jgi:hypothetical protein
MVAASHGMMKRRYALLILTTVSLLAAFLAPYLSPFLPRASFAQSSPDPRFGAVEAFHNQEAASDLNLGWERILFYWGQLLRNGPNDEWNIYHVEDGWLDDARKHGREVVGLIENTPAWATDGQPGSGLPRGLYLPIDDPNNLWAGFIRQLVKRYTGIIDHWVIWNEPDIEPPDDGLQFDGSVADYYQLVKVAYLVAKQENPNAVIHLAGLTYHHDVVHKRVPYLQRFIDEAKKDPTAAGHNFYFDVVTLHVYFNVDSVYDITQTFNGILRRNGLRKPIWINETNAAPSSDPLNPWQAPLFITELDQQANFIVQAFALGLAAGAQRIAVYKLADIPPYPPGFPAFGLIRADGTHRPAYDALKVVTTNFRDAREARLLRTATTEMVTLERGAQTTYVAWARTAATTTIALPAWSDTATLVALDGVTQTLTAVNGQFELTLPAAKCNDPNYGCTIGGTPLIVVAEAAARSNPVVIATATLPPSTPTLTPTPCGDCTSTPTSTPRPTRTPRPTQSATETSTATPSATPTHTATATASPTPSVEPSSTPRPVTLVARLARPIATTIASAIPAHSADISALTIVGLIVEVAAVAGIGWLVFNRRRHK